MQRDPAAPRLLGAPPYGGAGSHDDELGALERLHRAGLPLAPIALVPAEAEERFYRLNNLPERIAHLFAGVALDDPDEDDIEEIAPRARTLLRDHYLLDEAIDAFYEATGPLGPRLRLRRSDSPGLEVNAGRPALLALKRLWEEAWTFEALLARLRRTHALAPTATPVLIHGADAPLAPGEILRRARAALLRPRPVFGLADDRITRLGAVT